MKKILVLGVLAVMVMFGFSTTVKAKAVKSETTVAVQLTTNWDKVIDDYEKCINDYIAAYKKLKAGDNDAAAEINRIAQKMQELAQKLATAKGDLTDAQSKRIVALVGKLSAAMTE